MNPPSVISPPSPLSLPPQKSLEAIRAYRVFTVIQIVLLAASYLVDTYPRVSLLPGDPGNEVDTYQSFL